MLVLACRGDQDSTQRGRPGISTRGNYAREAYLACNAVPTYVIRLATSVTAAVLCRRSERHAFPKPISTSHLDASCVEACAFSDAVIHGVKLDVKPRSITDVRRRL